MRLITKLQFIYQNVKNYTSRAVITQLESKNPCLALHLSTRRPEQFCSNALLVELAHEIHSQKEGAPERTKSCSAAVFQVLCCILFLDFTSHTRLTIHITTSLFLDFTSYTRRLNSRFACTLPVFAIPCSTNHRLDAHWPQHMGSLR
jgi:hypothetical protein